VDGVHDLRRPYRALVDATDALLDQHWPSVERVAEALLEREPSAGTICALCF